MAFPLDDYTPHGYLDVPGHTRNLTPLGVLRSHGAGFRWHVPAHTGMYGGRRETYRAGFWVALGGAPTFAAHDHVASPYHSKNSMRFMLRHGTMRADILFHPAGDHALRALITAQTATRIAIHAEYTRLLAANGEWGESGLVGRAVPAGTLLQGFEDGHAFVLWTSQPPAAWGITPNEGLAQRWGCGETPAMPTDGFETVLGKRGEYVSLHAVLHIVLQPGETCEAILARGITEHAAQEHLAAARADGAAVHAARAADDRSFWATAPRLAGDWPDHWRRGLVYDLETLRMMVKQPVGIYRHIWDAMQIQAPRVVLAEAAIDALLLSYADPALAQQLLLGTFADAPMPNVPCSREDGSFNMVAADGTVCGTAPSWGYPWLVLEWLFAMRPDQAWLAAIYPHLVAYLEWWLVERTDANSWLFFACSWESGQDDSPRFGPQPLGGGHPVRHIRPVDLHAAFAHAAQVMARFASILGRADDHARWNEHADTFAERTHMLWHGTRYADYDTRAAAWSITSDIMLLAPLALRLADQAHTDALRPTLEALRADPLMWPVFAWTAIEAAHAAGAHALAADMAWSVADRAYRFWDARPAHPDRTLPGIACEYWPPDGRCGGEGYGWGAFGIHLALHTLLGFAPTVGALLLRPNLPAAWRTPGTSYRTSMHCRGRDLQITLAPHADGRVAVQVNKQQAEITWGETWSLPWDHV